MGRAAAVFVLASVERLVAIPDPAISLVPAVREV